ncbi:MAG: helix-turn-helix protein [Paenibacillus sp.]|nr:helix-turn-helix protein [Paenibacillus sp.]
MVDSAGRAYLGMLEQVKQIVDSRLQEMNGAAIQIMLNPKLQYLLNVASEADVNERYKFIDFMNDLRRTRAGVGWMNDFYIYFNDTRIILTPETKMDLDTFFSKIMISADAGYGESFKEKLTQYNAAVFQPSDILDSGSNRKRIISYMQTLPLGSKTVKGTLVINIDEHQISDLLRTVEMASQAQIYIMDSQKQILMETPDKKWDISDNLGTIVSDPANTTINDSQGKAIVVAHTISDQNGWIYIAAVPQSIVMQSVNKLKAQAEVLMVLYLLVGAIASYLLAYRNYNPIRELVLLLQKGKSAPHSKETDEFDYIKRMLSGSAYEERQLRDKLSRQKPIIRANFLSRLLRGHVDISAMTYEDLSDLGIWLPDRCFAVILIDIDDDSAFAKEDSEREWALARFIVANLGEDLIEGQGFVTELDRQRLAMLIGLQAEGENEAEPEIRAFVEKIKSVLDHRFHLQTTIAISSVQHGVERIESGYRQAFLALEYKIVKGSNSVIFYEETRGLQQHQYHYPIEYEVQLLNYAKTGNYAYIEKLLDHIYEMNFVSHKVTPENGKCLFFDMVSTLLKFMNSFQEKKVLYLLHERYDPIKMVLNRATAAEMLEKTKECYKAICEVVKETRSDHSEQLLESMKRYMDKHYADNSFNLTAMAESLDLTPKYLSSFFKKHTSQNIIDYVTEIRVNRAKQLLKDRSLTLLQIAQRVGYVNDAGLIRVFKKVEGVTPGIFRETLENMGGESSDV